MTEEEKPRPLIVSVEEKPVYIVADYPMDCPGEACDIKKQFSMPWKRCVVRIIESPHPTPLGMFNQKEEFVITSCEECRYNPAALAVIKELQAPKPAAGPDAYAYRAKKMSAKLGIQGLAGLPGPSGAGMANFFKDFVMPGLIESISKKTALYNRLAPISSGRTSAAIQAMAEADTAHHRHIEAHLENIQRKYNEQVAKMMENAAAGPKGTPLPLAPGEAAIKKALDEAFGEPEWQLPPPEKEDDDDY